MARTILCEIVTPEASIFSGEGTFVVVPAPDGEIGILPLHVPLVSALDAGEVRVEIDEKEEPRRFAVAGGYVEVYRDKVIVLADVAIDARDIDVAETEKCLEDLAERAETVGVGSGEAEQIAFEKRWCKTKLSVARTK